MTENTAYENIQKMTLEHTNEGDGTALSKILLENEELFEECLQVLDIHCYGCNFISDTEIEIIHDEFIS